MFATRLDWLLCFFFICFGWQPLPCAYISWPSRPSTLIFSSKSISCGLHDSNQGNSMNEIQNSQVYSKWQYTHAHSEVEENKQYIIMSNGTNKKKQLIECRTNSFIHSNRCGILEAVVASTNSNQFFIYTLFVRAMISDVNGMNSRLAALCLLWQIEYKSIWARASVCVSHLCEWPIYTQQNNKLAWLGEQGLFNVTKQFRWAQTDAPSLASRSIKKIE